MQSEKLELKNLNLRLTLTQAQDIIDTIEYLLAQNLETVNNDELEALLEDVLQQLSTQGVTINQ